MDLHLQPLSPQCAVSGRPFEPGDSVVSCLMREASGELIRRDFLESAGPAADSAEPALPPGGFVLCRWVHGFKVKRQAENSERELKLTAENLFLTLADPESGARADDAALVQCLALMLERKKVLRPRGTTEDGTRQIYEHARTKQVFEIAAVTMDQEFFSGVREKLSILIGPRKPKAPGAAEQQAAG